MGHAYVSSLYHIVFSTKERQRTITPELQQRLWPYIGGIARTNKMKALCVGGVEDHVHLLLSLPATVGVSEAIKRIKGSSSMWMHEEFPEFRHVYWQEGYGAFSIGISQVDATIRYIEGQAEHHRHVSFQEEFVAILKKHQMEWDERYIWG